MALQHIDRHRCQGIVERDHVDAVNPQTRALEPPLDGLVRPMRT